MVSKITHQVDQGSKLVKGNVRIGVHTRFGPNWPGKRCLAITYNPIRNPLSLRSPEKDTRPVDVVYNP